MQPSKPTPTRELSAREVDVMELSIAFGATIHDRALDRDYHWLRLVEAFDRLREDPDANDED